MIAGKTSTTNRTKNPMENSISKCILCEREKIKIQEVISFKKLKEIWNYGGIEIDRYLPDTPFLLKKCLKCSLQFFEPQIPGDNNFYNVFEKDKIHKDYYQLNWDHKVISKYILNNKLKSILDYGCGNGRFLKSLPEKIIKTGIDFNAKNEEKENLKFIKSNLLDFKTENKFEGVVCIQVLKHLPSPREYLEKMISFLEIGGYLFLAVPNREGILKEIENNGKCLDFPPHHLTRWSKRVLEKIGEIYNLKTIKTLEEPLSFAHFKWSMEVPISVHYPGKSLKNRILRRILFLKQKKKLRSLYPKFKEKIKGHSILAIFQK